MNPAQRARSLVVIEQIADLMKTVDSTVREVAAYTCIWGKPDVDGDEDQIDLRISLLREAIEQGSSVTRGEGPAARATRFNR